MSSFSSIAIPLGIALGLSLTVERVLELLKKVLTSTVSLDDVKRLGDLPNIHSKYKKLSELQYRYRNVHDAENKASDLARKLIDAADEERDVLLKELDQYSAQSEINESLPSIAVSTAKATSPRPERVQREVILQLFGFAIGIVLARVMELRLLSSFGIVTLQPWVDYLLTGLLIGGGSAPVHTILRFISKRKVTAKTDVVNSEEVKKVISDGKTVLTEKKSLDVGRIDRLSSLKEITYYGGVDKEILEWIHVRKNNPDMIVYHHTTLNRSSSFDDVVNVIKSRKDSKGNSWVTGYNCVITEHGGIHPFCRWDRYGNHAAGLNSRSLGLAFNGNFETTPSVPFSNPDGRYGPSVPTDEQLDSGARTVALWCHIYDIPLDFDKKIIPHRKISPKSCPGNNFPYSDFEALIRKYHAEWSSDKAQEYIKTFSNKKYLKV